MYWLYSAALLLALVLTTPYFLYQALAHKKYLGSLAARLTLKSIPSVPQPQILLHCVSVGEFLAAEPLIEHLRTTLPDYHLVISTTTATGQALAQERAASFATICYFPLDFTGLMRRFLQQIQPQAIIILETELWPNFLRMANQQQIPIFIANGRISDRSFRRYTWAGRFLKPILSNVTCFLMQSAEDATRIKALGAQPSQVVVCGNIKYDFGTPTQAERLNQIAQTLLPWLQLQPNQLLIVAGSTTPGEEEILLTIYQQILAIPTLAQTRLLIAPRRPERFTEVATLIQTRFPLLRRSEYASDNMTQKGNVSEAVLLLDSVGELAAVYRYATLVFVGGSLVPKGGHNILEPALSGRAIITGPYMNNFHKIMADFLAAQAVVQLPSLTVQATSSEIVASALPIFKRLLQQPGEREALGQRAQAVLAANRGAIEQHLTIIREFIKQKKSTSDATKV